MLPCNSNHLLGPRETDVATDDLQLGELEGDFVDVRNGSPYFAWTQRTSMAYLGQERNVKLAAFDK
jgi:hypothetical protein